MTSAISNLKMTGVFFVAVSAIGMKSFAAESDLGVFLEPALTYEIGDTNVNYPSPFSNSTGRSEGFGLGARVGMHIHESFFAGFDGRYSMTQFRDSSVSYDARATAKNFAVVGGMQMPNIGVRIWGSYIFNGDLNPEKSSLIDVKFQNGKGFRLGAGFRIAAVSLNLEYQQLKYDQTTLEEIGPFSSSSVFNSVQLDNRTWIVSASFPIEL